jgi:hypothetical protein
MPSRGQPSLPPTTSVQGHLARTTIGKWDDVGLALSGGHMCRWALA